MDPVVLSALISGAFAFLGTVIGIVSTGSKTAYRIQQLERKVDQHNNLIERTYKLEARMTVLEKEEGGDRRERRPAI